MKTYLVDLVATVAVMVEAEDAVEAQEKAADLVDFPTDSEILSTSAFDVTDWNDAA